MLCRTMFFVGDCVGGSPSSLTACDATIDGGTVHNSSGLLLGGRFGGREVRPLPPSDPRYVRSAVVMSQLAWGIYIRKPQVAGQLRGRDGAGGAVAGPGCYYGQLGHTVVNHGKTADVAWLITDAEEATDRSCVVVAASSGQTTSVDSPFCASSPRRVRTITLKGFDSVDREADKDRLIANICSSEPEVLAGGHVQAHSGLLSIARKLYREIRMYIDFLPPNTRLVLSGHSVGGSLSLLLMLLLLDEHGVDFLKRKLLNVYTFGSPPVVALTRLTINTDFEDAENNRNRRNSPRRSGRVQESSCDVLTALGLPPSMVQGYVQPWDPFVRFFTESCAIFPVIGDIGEDGVTPYASGPARALRPFLRAAARSWGSWPGVRDSLSRQRFSPVGLQHVLLPSRERYDRDLEVLGPDTALSVPGVERIVRLPSVALLPALDEAFPLDASNLSEVLVALRGINHHLPESYSAPFVKFACMHLSSK